MAIGTDLISPGMALATHNNQNNPNLFVGQRKGLHGDIDVGLVQSAHSHGQVIASISGSPHPDPFLMRGGYMA